MTFIDQTFVAIAIPAIQDDLSLSATGVQAIVNGYLQVRAEEEPAKPRRRASPFWRPSPAPSS